MTQTVLLTGATGFVGSHVLHALVASDYRVVALKRSSSDLWRLAGIGPGVEFVDVGAAPLPQIMADHNVSAVVHTACDQGRDGGDIKALLETNVLFGIELLQAAIASSVERFINFDTLLDASVNAYALSKKQFANWLPHFSADIHIVNLRLGNVYGPMEPSSGFLSWLIGEFERGAQQVRLTPGEQQRDFVHAADVASACVAVLALRPEDALLQLDVGSGELLTIKTFVEQAWQAYRAETGSNNTRLDFGALAYRPGEVMTPVFDTSTLFSLGWQPARTLEQGLSQTIRARREGGSVLGSEKE